MKKFKLLILLILVTSSFSLFAQFDEVEYVPENELGSSEIDVSKILGKIPGAGSVSRVGGALYDVPIELPPGINGLVPSLAVNYNSQSGEGIVGYGWHFSGLSSITRGARQYYAETSVAKPQHDKTDPYYFNGQRLVYNFSPAYLYGENGSTYILRKMIKVILKVLVRMRLVQYLLSADILVG